MKSKKNGKKGKISKLFVPIVFSLLLLFVSSCVTLNIHYDTVYSEPIVNDSFINATIDGTLTHVQYYNKHDVWDFRSISIKLCFSDKDVNLSMYDSFISYDCSPAYPSNGVNSVLISNCKYQDYKGEFHEIPDRSFSVKIVDYPYPDSSKDFAAMVIPTIVIFLSMTAVIVISLLKKERKDQ